MFLNYIFWSVAAFYSGSIMYSYLVPKLLFKKDITKMSKDGNPGCGNVFTCIGIPCGILCLTLELMKGAFPVWLASNHLSVENPLFSLVIVSPIIGHAFSPMMRSRGGKAIAVSFGSFIGIFPHMLLLFWLAIPLVIFSTVIRIYPHSLRVMTSFLSMFVFSILFEQNRTACISAAIIAAVVIYKHYGDFIKREKRQADIYIFSHCLFHHSASENSPRK